MASVGLLYVGAVLIVNGLMLLGRVDARAAAPLNLFVGTLQVVTPTYLIFTSGGNPDTILGASGLYLFGVIWLYWAVLWALFFLVLGLKREELTRFTGAIAVVAGVVTCAVPAFLLLTGVWQDSRRTAAIVIAALCLLSLGLYPVLRGEREPVPAGPAPELRAGEGAGTGRPTTEMYGNVAQEQQPTPDAAHAAPRRRR
jgi:hypothetical protein